MKKLMGFIIVFSFILLSLGFSTPVHAAAAPVNVTYQAYVQNIGWQTPVLGNTTAGTIARSLRLEALKVSLVNAPAGSSISYSVHILNVGWQSVKSNGTLAGITGRGYSIDAVRITLGNMPGYSIEYQSYIRNVGWQTWKYNGEISGTVNRGYRIEAFRIRIVKISDNNQFAVNYSSHLRGVGWQTPVLNGQLSGTEGRGYRIDALRINLVNAPVGGKIVYQTYVSGLGWRASVSNGATSGVIAGSYGIRAIKVSLQNMPGSSVQYRVRNGLGNWSPWVSNGAIAGVTTSTLQVEALEIRIVSNPLAMIFPTSISLNKTTATLNVGTTEILVPNVLPTNASVKNVVWTSSNPTVATVSTSGVVTAIKAGTASITATTIWGKVSSSCLVTVVVPVNSISVSGTGGATGIAVNHGTLQMLATVSPINATNKAVTWSLSNTDVATISTTGLLTAVANGTVTVTATSVSNSAIVGSLLVTVSNQPVTPSAPLVENDDNLNTVTGMTTAMEYKLDSSAYVPYNASIFNALNLSGNHTLLVRVAAEGINPVSADTTLIFTASNADLAEDAVSAYETAPISTLLEIASADELKSLADTAVALVSDNTQRTDFELRITNKTNLVLIAKAEFAVSAYETAPISTLVEIANADELKSPAEAAVALVGDSTLRGDFEQRIDNKTNLILIAKAEFAVSAYETAPISTLVEIASADELKSPAEMAVALVNDSTLRNDFELRIVNRTNLILIAKAEFAVSAYETAPISTLMEIASADELKSPAEIAVALVIDDTQRIAFENRILVKTAAIIVAKAEFAVVAYETAPITTLLEIASADELKSPAEIAVALVGDSTLRTNFELRITNKTNLILIAKAEFAVVAYETAPITTLLEIASADELKSLAEMAVALVSDSTIRTNFELRITNKTNLILIAKAEFAVAAYEVAPISTLLEIASADELKSPAEMAVALVSDSTIRTAFELRITNKTNLILIAKAEFAVVAYETAPITTLLEIASADELKSPAEMAVALVSDNTQRTAFEDRLLIKTAAIIVAKAEFAVVAYETAPITNLTLITVAEELKAPADTAVALVSNTTLRTAFALRITNRTNAIATAKAALKLAEAIAAINTAPNATAMSLAISTHATTLGLNLTNYNALTDTGRLNVQNNLIPTTYSTSAQIKSAFDTYVLQQTALLAVNTATTSTMGSVITTYSTVLALNSAILADYNLLTAGSKEAVYLALANQAFPTSLAVNTAFNNAVSVLILNEITVDATMKAAITRYTTIIGLNLTSYNLLSTTFKTNVHTALMAAVMTTKAEVIAAFDAAVAQATIDYAVWVINIQVYNYMDRDIRAYGPTLGLVLTDYDALINKAPLLTAMVAEPFTSAAQIKTFFDAFVAQQKALEAIPMLDAFNNAPDAATMANVIGIYSTLFNATDYNTYNNFIGTPAKTIIQNAMLVPTYLTERDVQMAFIIGIINNQYINLGKQVFNNNYVFLGLSTSLASNEFMTLTLAERTVITNAVFAARPIVSQEQILLVAVNNVSTASYIGTLINLNSSLFGLDLTLYNTIADKTPVFNALMGKAFTSIAELKAAFDAEVAILTVVDATLESPKEYNLDLPEAVTSLVTLNSATTITGISEVYNAYTLILDTDYTFDPLTSTLTITPVGLGKLAFVPGDTLLFDVSFDVGQVAQLTVNVTGTLITSAYIDSPQSFNTTTPAPVTSIVILNSATTITGIDYYGAALVEGVDYTFNALTGDLVIAQDYITDLGAIPGDIIPLNVTFDVGFASELTIFVISDDIVAVGSATAFSNTSVITYTLTTGIFDPITAIDPANWMLSGFAFADLGDISSIVLSNGDTVATLSITGTAIPYTFDYIIEPMQAAFPSGFLSPSYSYITVIDPYAEGNATAVTGTQTITYNLTFGALDPTEAVLSSNWVLSGTDVADLGSISNIVLSNADTTVTFTISGTVGDNTKIYSIAPDLMVFINYGYSAPVLPAEIIVTP